MENDKGIPHCKHSNQLAGSLTIAALHQGMTRIDQVQLNDDGERAFGLCGITPFIDYNHMAIVETANAVRTSLTQCSAQAKAAYLAWQQ